MLEAFLLLTGGKERKRMSMVFFFFSAVCRKACISASLGGNQADLIHSAFQELLEEWVDLGVGVTPSTKSFSAQTLGIILSCFHPHIRSLIQT